VRPKWSLLICIGIFIFLSGILGWYQYYGLLGKTLSPFTAINLSAQLFTQPFIPSLLLIVSDAFPTPPVLLTFARFAALIFSLFTVFTLVFSIFKELWANIRIFFGFRNHLILLGDSRKTQLLLEDVLKNSPEQRIVLILTKNSKKGEYPKETARYAMLSAETVTTSLLLRTGLSKAAKIILLEDDDLLNLERLKIVEEAASRIKRTAALKVMLHLRDSSALPAFKELKGFDVSGKADVHAFQWEQRFAAYIADKFFPRVLEANPFETKEIVLLVVGNSQLFEPLAREWIQMYRLPGDAPLKILQVLDNLKPTPGFLRELADRVEWTPYENIAFFSSPPVELINQVKLCVILNDDERELYSDCWKTRRYFYQETERMENPTIVLPVSDHRPYWMSMPKITENLRKLDIETVYFEEAVSAGEILDGTERIDTLAKAIHEDYAKSAQSRIKEGWEKLNDAVKDENRVSARHIDYKLSFLGLECAEESDPREAESLRNLSPETVEQLSRLEHHRWEARKRVCGYVRYPKTIDRWTRDTLKLHPDIREWETLSGDDKAKDAEFLRYDQILRRIGLKIVRKEP